MPKDLASSQPRDTPRPKASSFSASSPSRPAYSRRSTNPPIKECSSKDAFGKEVEQRRTEEERARHEEAKEEEQRIFDFDEELRKAGGR
jgi:hypothetical protein